MAYYHTNTPTNMPLFIWPNMLVYMTLATSSDMTTTIPNPSSEIATMPGVNLLDPSRRYITRSRGCFRIYSATNKGYVYAPNTKLYLDESLPGGEETITMTEGTYTDPLDLAAHIETQINANANLSQDYTVSYSDPRTDGASATFKWTISRAGGNFEINGAGKNDDILESLGFDTNTDYSGAATYTGENAACHTEEYWIIKWPGNLETYWAGREGGRQGNVNGAFFTWLALLDTNIRCCGQSAYADGGPKQAPKIYLYSKGTVEFDDDPTGHSEGTDLFTFPMDTSAADAPSYFSIDSSLYSPEATYVGQSYGRMILIDFADWANDFDWLDGYGYAKLVISDPRHPDGYVQLGTMPCGPGWYPGRGYSFSTNWKKVDPSELKRTGSGLRMVKTRGGMYRQATVSYARSGIGDGTYSTGAVTWEDSPFVEFNYRIFERMIENSVDDVTAGALTNANEGAIGRGRVPFLFIDRTINPVVGGSDRSSGVPGSFYQTHGYTPFTMYCYLEDDPEWERQFASRWGVDFKLTEEAY